MLKWSIFVIAMLATFAGAETVVKDVEFCKLAKSPAMYVGKTVRVRAVNSGNLDNIPWLMSRACTEGAETILYDVDNGNTALQPLNAYRVPDTVMQAGAFEIWATWIGRIQRETPRSGYMLNDTGYHFVLLSVSEIEAVHVRLCGDTSDTSSGSCWGPPR